MFPGFLQNIISKKLYQIFKILAFNKAVLKKSLIQPNKCRTAEQAEITAAYKRLARLYHPDKHQVSLEFLRMPSIIAIVEPGPDKKSPSRSAICQVEACP